MVCVITLYVPFVLRSTWVNHFYCGDRLFVHIVLQIIVCHFPLNCGNIIVFLFFFLLRYKPSIIPYGIFKLSNRYLKYVKLKHMFIQVNMVIYTFTMNSVFVLRTGTYIKWVHNRSKTSPSILTRIRCAGIASDRT